MGAATGRRRTLISISGRVNPERQGRSGSMDKLAASEDSESLGPSSVALVQGDLLNLGHTPVFRDALGSTVTVSP